MYDKKQTCEQTEDGNLRTTKKNWRRQVHENNLSNWFPYQACRWSAVWLTMRLTSRFIYWVNTRSGSCDDNEFIQPAAVLSFVTMRNMYFLYQRNCDLKHSRWQGHLNKAQMLSVKKCVDIRRILGVWKSDETSSDNPSTATAVITNCCYLSTNVGNSSA